MIISKIFYRLLRDLLFKSFFYSFAPRFRRLRDKPEKKSFFKYRNLSPILTFIQAHFSTLNFQSCEHISYKKNYGNHVPSQNHALETNNFSKTILTWPESGCLFRAETGSKTPSGVLRNAETNSF